MGYKEIYTPQTTRVRYLISTTW